LVLVLVVLVSAQNPDTVPQCSWACDNPTADAICEPVCDPPVCETQCTAGQPTQCSAPSCSVQCPPMPGLDIKGGCPMCETVCAPLSCSAGAVCTPLCEPTNCSWSCRRNSLMQRPSCQMVCEAPACEYIVPSAGNALSPRNMLGAIGATLLLAVMVL